jgi:glycosyltransferase involved in cell wall biosynthesis
MKKIHIVLSAPQMFGFMRGQGARLRTLGYRATVISAVSESLDRQAAEDGVVRRIIPITRHISLLSDFMVFVSLCKIFQREKPDAVLLSGPKAIFLAGMAAWLVGIPQRIVVYHGMRQEVMQSPLRHLLNFCDRTAFACASKVLAVSPSLRELVVSRRLCPRYKISVTGNGTANGIDCNWFKRTPEIQAQSELIQKSYQIDKDATVVGFVGRITEDKGIIDLLDTFDEIAVMRSKVVLLLVGPEEIKTLLLRQRWSHIRGDLRIIWVGNVVDVRPYLQLMHVHIFPTTREGFGLAVAEAAAMQVPSVGYATTGVIDAIEHGQTGTLVPPGDLAALLAAVLCYIDNRDLCLNQGASARERVIKLFSPSSTWASYEQSLSEA